MQDHPIPLDVLIVLGAELINSNGRANSILRSVMALVSLISSLSLIWMIKGSRAGLTTTYHRILLGMSVADILYSIGQAHFNLTAPSEDDYYVWNAHGTQATCTAQGFVMYIGSNAGLLYSCSLNLYSLAVVRYKVPDARVRARIEPFLLGVPAAYSLASNVALLAGDNLNINGGGVCYSPVYDPPHCVGYEDGQVREGFSIPCGRGRDGLGFFAYANVFIVSIVPPLVVGISLWMIYRSVVLTERRIARYGAGALALAANAGNAENDESLARTSSSSGFGSRISNSVMSFVRSLRPGVQSRSASNQTQSNSRLVLHRAIAYSVAFFLAWSFPVIGICFDLAGKDWPTAIWYLSSIFNPLQGLFNFLIFMYPKVAKAKSKSRSGENVGWCRTFVAVFLARGSAPTSGGNEGRQPRDRAQQHRHRAPVEGKQGEPKVEDIRDANRTEAVTNIVAMSLDAQGRFIQDPHPKRRPSAVPQKDQLKRRISRLSTVSQKDQEQGGI